MPYHVTQSKIVRPEAEGFLPRSKLFDRFDEMRDREMLWVASPAGSGKTASVTSYITARRLNCIWYSVDEGDVDLATFFYFLGQAAALVVQGDKPKNLPLFTMEYLHGVPEFSCNFFDRLSQRLSLPAVLVFDNIHHIPADASLHKAVIAGLNRLPPRLQVIMISRNHPPASYSRLRANRQLGLIGWKDLRLRRDECEAMVRLRLERGTLSKEQLASIHNLTEGWAAGVQLLLVNMLENGSRELSLPQKVPEDIFNYFAEEIYKRLDPSLRRFLLRSVFLPWITRHTVETLVAPEGDASYLDYLVHNNLFIETSSGIPPTFRYHPLFRKFLLRHAAMEYKPEAIRDMQLQDAQLLLEDGYTDDGSKLLVQAGGWHQLADLIVREAPRLVRQGRSGMVQRWLRHLPEDMFQKNPMLLYWRGISCFPHDFDRGREYLQQAYLVFRQLKDPTGLYLSCLATMGSLCQEIRTSPLSYWIDELNSLLSEYPQICSGRIESQVIKVMLPGYLFAQPQHPALHVWAAKAEALIAGGVELSLELGISAYLALYYYWIGLAEKLSALLLRLRSLPNSSEVSPLLKLVMLNMEVLCFNFMGDFHASRLAYEQGLSLADASGIKPFRMRFLLQGAYASLAHGDVAEAESFLKVCGPSISPSDSLNASLFYHFSSMTEACNGRLTEALFLSSEALRFASEANMPFGMAACHVGYAQIHTDLGNYREAAIHLQEARNIAEATQSLMLDYVCLLYETYLAFAGQKQKKGHRLLKRGFEMGRRHGFLHPGWWVPHAVSSLCIKALKAGIEVEYARKLIAKHRLTPAVTPVTVENWPWPVRIYTLGRFELVLDDKPYRPRKAPEKALALLKVLLALGGRQVPEMRLAEVLWPDSEGDMQYQTMKTTLHRLRALLGLKDAVKHVDRMMTLDPRQCWVDAWAFERLVDEADRQLNAGEIEVAMKSYDEAYRYYQGEFLASEDHSYALATRQRMRRKFIGLAEMLGRHLEDRHKVDEAVLLYENVLDHTPEEEKVYQRLMRCHLQGNRLAEAAEVYKRCHRVLVSKLGVAPSPATIALYKETLSDK